jgi:hypothetical protein
MPAGRRKRTGGNPITRHPLGSDVDGAPALISEIEIDVAGMLGDADVDGALGTVELRPRLE